jgi:hypothetical protein
VKTIYFIDENGGARVRPTSTGDMRMWTEWFLKHGMRKVSREEYEAAKKRFRDIDECEDNQNAPQE